MRPADDFVADEEFEKTVMCSECDEQLIKMFMNDHKCDPEKLKKLARNKDGQLAEPLSGSDP